MTDALAVGGRYTYLSSIVTTKSFLDASKHLYKRLGPSVGPSIRWSVTTFFKTGKLSDSSLIIIPGEGERKGRWREKEGRWRRGGGGEEVEVDASLFVLVFKDINGRHFLPLSRLNGTKRTLRIPNRSKNSLVSSKPNTPDTHRHSGIEIPL